MANLFDLQNSFAAALLAGDFSNLKAEFIAGRADAGRRLDIFRNNTFASLTQALKITFPVTMQLADERFFAYVAHEFIAAFPPNEARLAIYGERFPAFLRRFPACRAYPIIAEMASLEWAIADSLNAPEELPARPSILENLEEGGEVALLLQPSLRFVISRWSLLSVWSDHKAHGSNAQAPLQRASNHIAVLRHGSDLQFLQLADSRFAFWRSMARGLSVNRAAERALARDPLFDLISETLLLFRMGLVTGLSHEPSAKISKGEFK